VSGGPRGCWNPGAETAPREERAALQLERLREQLARASRLPLYRTTMEESGVSPETLRSLDDLARLPFTTKADLRDGYPFGLCPVPLADVVRIHATSGTTGKPTVSPYTRADLALWAEVMARVLAAGGVTRDDVVHNAYGHGLFTGGLGFGLGAETIGCATVPVSSGLTRRQVMLIEDFGATVLTCTPSYALVIAEEAEAQGVDPLSRFKLRVGFFGAEPWTEEIRREIEGRLGLEAFDSYGLAEIIGPGVAAECPAHDGLHIFEDHFLPEVIDPDSGRRLPWGSTGELVLTALSREALPLLRYRTRDRVRLFADPCACGRTLCRMSRVLGRTDDMLVIRGVNVFPSQIEHALLGVDGLAPQYQIAVTTRADRQDELRVAIEARAGAGAEAADRAALEARTREVLRSALGLAVVVEIVAPGTLPRSEGKAVRIVDERRK